MSEEVKPIKKHIIYHILVYCPKFKEIVEPPLMCLTCPFFRGEDMYNVLCAYKEEVEQEKHE
jgi:hypothetical protein